MSAPISILELRSVRGTGGGPEKTILLGAARHRRDRFSVTVCYLRDTRDAVFGIDRRAGALDLDYLEIRERHSFDRGIWSQLKRLVVERQFDIVHAHEYKTDLLAWLLWQRTGVLPLATAHGWTGNSTRERLLYYPVDKRILTRFPRAIAVSSDIKHELVQHGARPERVTVLLNGIDPAAFCRQREREAIMRAQLGLDERDVVIGTVGRLEQQKRIDLLLEALPPLIARHPRLKLIVAGDGSLMPQLKVHATQLGLETVVHFLGLRQDVAELHHAFDLFVQSSDYEGTPNALLEAMAMETPAVATDVGGTSELARPGVDALIVPPGDVEALRTAITTVIADPDAARVRAASARRRIETDLSFARRTEILEGIYEEMAGQRRAALTAAAHA